ncbi:MFS general substrate transporter [Trametes coccinea BRFM310]|uniref:MFS general substrate transporter n=1 Tax=Trametes coccinea (strain BRFM310) TaxID=1353009 RepID=A0A1Y2ICX0_TRAC3|nr:MFS general substrate transporter [Trametes coccinea BRFM310]
MASSSTYQAVDAVVSSNFSIYAASVSRARDYEQPTDSQSRVAMPNTLSSEAISEQDLLLGGNKRAKKPFYRPRPLWLVPFAIVASIVRGMTLAPRVQVYTQLSCNAIYGHDVYNHTGLDVFHPAAAHHVLYPHFNTLTNLFHPSMMFVGSTSESEDLAKSATDQEEPDPRLPPSKRCLDDPAVLAGAARLQTIMTTTMGALSAITTGWWGTFGQRHGRTRVLAAATLGLFLTDLVFILVSTPHSIFAAHGHKLLVVSPVIEGLLGGWATLQAATSAYVSDCTSDGSRAHIFSRFTGVFYFGFAVGPTIGAYLIRHPFIPIFSPAIGVHNGAPTVTSVFYVAATASFINLLLALFLFPESLEKKRAKATSSILQPALPASVQPNQRGVLASVRTALLGFLTPLALFLPKTVVAPNGQSRMDWSMTLLAIVLFGHLLSLGLFQLKYLYAENIYKWGAEQLSYYISFMGFARAVHLLLVLPFLITTFKPKPSSIQTAASMTAQSKKSSKKSFSALAKEMRFDLSLIRGSLFIDFLSHSIVALSPAHASQALFVGATSLSSFGAGLVPATNSLALCIMQARDEDDTGKLFGAFSVLQAVGQMILGPALFGLIYFKTVATFPKAIFAVAGGILVVSLAVLCLVRPDAELKGRRKARSVGPSTLDEDVEQRRGRSRASKDLRPSSMNNMQAAASYGSTIGSGRDTAV